MDPRRILMLVSDAYGGFGGISQFNRDFLSAIDASGILDQAYVLPRVIDSPVAQSIPQSIVFDQWSATSKGAFILRALTSVQVQRCNLVICGHVNFLPLAWAVSKLHRAPLALIIHGSEAWQRHDRRSVNAVASRVDNVIAVSNYSARRFACWTGVNPKLISIIPPSVDLDRFYPREPDPELLNRHRLHNKKVLLTVGRLDPNERQKGFDQVIEVLPRLLSLHPSVRYVIAGDGLDAPRLHAKVASMQLTDKVIFAGRIAEAEKTAYYNLADVFVMPSSQEGFGIVLIEAAACGVRVVGSTVGGCPEALLNGRLGKLVNPGSPDELLHAVDYCLGSAMEKIRPDGIDFFGRESFERRVSEWLRESLGWHAPAAGASAGLETQKVAASVK